jgi:cytochrome c551
MMRTLWMASALVAVGCGGEGSQSTEERVDAIVALEGDVAAGEAIYDAECASCHGAEGEGGVGPAMEEVVAGHDEWAMVDVLVRGVGGMPSFDDLDDQSIADVTAYSQATW